MASSDSAMQAHYAKGLESDRLGGSRGVLEFVRTQQILRRALPSAPATIADIGGGPGRYAFWLAGSGYAVELRDPVLLHVEQVRAANVPAVRAAVGDARPST